MLTTKERNSHLLQGPQISSHRKSQKPTLCRREKNVHSLVETEFLTFCATNSHCCGHQYSLQSYGENPYCVFSVSGRGSQLPAILQLINRPIHKFHSFITFRSQIKLCCYDLLFSSLNVISPRPLHD